MEISGQCSLAADASALWAALHDAEALKRSLPGCRRLQEEAPGKYRFTISLGAAPMLGHYEGCAALRDLVAQQSCQLTLMGQGRSGRLFLDVSVTLAPAVDRTEVSWQGTVHADDAVKRVPFSMVLPGVGRLLLRDFLHGLAREARRRHPPLGL